MRAGVNGGINSPVKETGRWKNQPVMGMASIFIIYKNVVQKNDSKIITEVLGDLLSPVVCRFF